MKSRQSLNLDTAVAAGFGDEWRRFDQSTLSDADRARIFDEYFRIFPWADLPANPVGADIGCGSGRWAALVAPRVGRLFCIDASREALAVAERNLSKLGNCDFAVASVGELPLQDSSLDFAYSLGVLHHVPDTAAAVRSCVTKLKPGAPLLLYLYYRFDNRPAWFRFLWRCTDLVRRLTSRLPYALRYAASQVIAVAVYWPLARLSRALERGGLDTSKMPLSYYRNRSFYVMRTDALDRFGTRLEQRFTRAEILRIMANAGLRDVHFSDSPPYWCAVGHRV
jgi:SAM-dependent methyltransferase